MLTPRPSHRTRQAKHQDFSKSSVVVKKESHAIKLSASPTPELGGDNERGWEHSDELPIFDASTWTQSTVMKELITNAFHIPGRPTKRTYFTQVTCADGTTTVVPQAYRVPLMFVSHFLWESVRLVLRAGEWEEFKVGILHVSRVCQRFLELARAEMEQGGMGRAWRCKEMDRVLVRYRLGWLISDESHLREFWEMYGDAEYRKDPVKRVMTNWEKVALKGHKGFRLTEEQIEHGYPVEDMMKDIGEKDGTWVCGEFTGMSAFAYFERFRETQKWGNEPAVKERKPKMVKSAAIIDEAVLEMERAEEEEAEKKKVDEAKRMASEAKREADEAKRKADQQADEAKRKAEKEKEKEKTEEEKKKVSEKQKQKQKPPLSSAPLGRAPASYRPAIIMNSVPPPSAHLNTIHLSHPYQPYSTFPPPPSRPPPSSRPPPPPPATPFAFSPVTQNGATPYGSTMSYPAMKSSLPTILEAIEVFKTQNTRIAALERELSEVRCAVRAREMEGMGVGWAAGLRHKPEAGGGGWGKRPISHLLDEGGDVEMNEVTVPSVIMPSANTTGHNLLDEGTPIKSRRKLDRLDSKSVDSVM